jgi:hypothetical protein
MQIARLRSAGALVLIALGSACSSSSTTLLGPALVKCATTLSTPGPMAAAGGLSSLTVSALPECGWTAAAQANWITDLTPTSGQGDGQIQFRIAPNPTTSPRQADILLNDVPVRLTQHGSACSFTVTPLAPDVASSGAIVNLVVTTGAACGWTITSGASWVTVSGQPPGSGPGEVEVEVAPNTGPSRSASVSIAGHTVVINQRAD